MEDKMKNMALYLNENLATKEQFLINIDNIRPDVILIL